MNKFVDSLDLPKDLRDLDKSQLQVVIDELRAELIDTISICGGHFASSLGAAELSLVLHYLFKTPDDRIIWDVGHQGYIHKMLTGRRSQLSTIRQQGGISGFLKRDESEFDNFGAGHAGTSISAGVGMAVALAQQDSSRYVVPVIGDGSMTCGMAFEALNHAGELGLKNLIVILNDNEMSISPNVGAHRWLFSRAMTSKPTVFCRSRIKSLHQQGYIPATVYKMFDRAQTAAQGFFSGPAMLFESFRFRYIGPINGHSISDLIEALSHAKDQEVPVLVHVKTSKGAGYSHAEEDPIKWHAVRPFDPTKGEFLKTTSTTVLPPTYTQIFAETLLEIAKEDPKVVAVTAAMAEGTGLDLLRREIPNSFFDVGICEQHAVTFAAGLSCEGYKPVCAIYSTFLQRGYDQVIHDVCIQNLPVVFAIDRAGVVGNDGETHQGQFDIAYLRCIPNLILMAPSDEVELRNMIKASISYNCPVGIRYPRGHALGIPLEPGFLPVALGKARIMREGSDVLLLAVGPLVYECLEVANQIEQLKGLSTTVVDMRFIKPLDKELLSKLLPAHKLVCTVEDHALAGGFGSAVLEFINTETVTYPGHLKRFGLRDEFITHASQKEQLENHGCLASHIKEFIVEHFSNYPEVESLQLAS
jgi:1-deoxy-D-xylulose-5-phosphate synthase